MPEAKALFLYRSKTATDTVMQWPVTQPVVIQAGGGGRNTACHYVVNSYSSLPNLMEPEPSLMDPLPILMDATLPAEVSTAASSSGEAPTEGVGVLGGGALGVETWQSASSVAPTLAVVLPSGQLGWGCV